MASAMAMYALRATNLLSLSTWIHRPWPLHQLGTARARPLPLIGFPHRIVGFCHGVAALKAEKDELIKGLERKSTDPVKRVLEQARKVASRKEIVHTDFLTPPIVEDALLSLKKLADVEVLVQGGYPQAERCRLSIGHCEVMSSVPGAVAALSISGNFAFAPASHGDFLGAVLGTGISREKVGDILLQGEKGAQVLVVPELVDYLVSSVKQVRSVPVSCSSVPLLALEIQPPRKKVFKSVEASLRVDAIASAGFQMSRSKLVSLISSGDVRVNWSEVTKNGATLKTGDIISIRGKGRVQVGEINTTRKGKYAVELTRYL